ncbi:hypothetical protein R3P38DRAFT_3566660 [Favolaschia claudopus]|uniref:Uncharacterized protein n=1 Tax=Favolaschia claudopus TaxID=2862362 RepID=A0AAW0DUW2_9AGAR
MTERPHLGLISPIIILLAIPSLPVPRARCCDGKPALSLLLTLISAHAAREWSPTPARLLSLADDAHPFSSLSARRCILRELSASLRVTLVDARLVALTAHSNIAQSRLYLWRLLPAVDNLHRFMELQAYDLRHPADRRPAPHPSYADPINTPSSAEVRQLRHVTSTPSSPRLVSPLLTKTSPLQSSTSCRRPHLLYAYHITPVSRAKDEVEHCCLPLLFDASSPSYPPPSPSSSPRSPRFTLTAGYADSKLIGASSS